MAHRARQRRPIDPTVFAGGAGDTVEGTSPPCLGPGRVRAPQRQVDALVDLGLADLHSAAKFLSSQAPHAQEFFIGHLPGVVLAAEDQIAKLLPSDRGVVEARKPEPELDVEPVRRFAGCVVAVARPIGLISTGDDARSNRVIVMIGKQASAQAWRYFARRGPICNTGSESPAPGIE